MKRRVLAQALGFGPLALLLRPAQAHNPDDLSVLDNAVAFWAAGTPVGVGRVTLEVPPLVENGNGVPITVRVQSPMTAEAHVRQIAVFNQRNPHRDVIQATLGPRAGKAEFSTRIRLATTQELVALARFSDGSIGSHRVEVLVTLAACAE